MPSKIQKLTPSEGINDEGENVSQLRAKTKYFKPVRKYKVSFSCFRVHVRFIEFGNLFVGALISLITFLVLCDFLNYVPGVQA